jgi:hypothetical protein
VNSLNQGVDIIFQKRRPLAEIPSFRDGQQPKLREMILVKFWFWSFWFLWTQRVCAGNLSASIRVHPRLRIFVGFPISTPHPDPLPGRGGEGETPDGLG